MSKRLAPTNWQLPVKIFEADGFCFERKKGSHRSYIKEGILRPIIIPEYDEVGIDIIKSNMRTANMSRDRYFELLELVK